MFQANVFTLVCDDLGMSSLGLLCSPWFMCSPWLLCSSGFVFTLINVLILVNVFILLNVFTLVYSHHGGCVHLDVAQARVDENAHDAVQLCKKASICTDTWMQMRC